MLKLTFRCPDGRSWLFLGLNRENVVRLSAGKPLVFTGEGVGLPELERVVIAAGETYEGMAQEFVKRGMMPEEYLEQIRRSDEEPGFAFRATGDDE